MKYIRKRIETELGGLVRCKIDPLVGPGQEQPHGDVAGVIDDILASEELVCMHGEVFIICCLCRYSELLYSLLGATRTAVDELVGHIIMCIHVCHLCLTIDIRE